MTSDAGAYSETSTSLARSIAVRKANMLTPEFPAAPYIENIGVRPNVQDDFATEENLRLKGKPFVDGFVKTFVDYLAKH